MRPKVTVYTKLWFALTNVVSTFRVYIEHNLGKEYQPVLDKLLEAQELFKKISEAK